MANDLYSNSSNSSRNGGGWVYIDGELYHYGRQGQKWYQTIFGGIDNPKSLTYDPNYGKSSVPANRINSNSNKTWNLNTKLGRKNLFRYVGNTANKIKSNFNKYYYEGTKQDVRDRYDFNKKMYDNYISKRNNGAGTHLQKLVGKQIDDANASRNRTKGGSTSLLDTLNIAIQNSQFGIVNGINNFLVRKGWDDEVDNFLSMIFGDSDAITSRKNKERYQNNKTNTGYNKAEERTPEYTGGHIDKDKDKKNNKTNSGKRRMSGYQ